MSDVAIEELARLMKRKGLGSLHKITKPNIEKIALVANPASGHRWHLLKRAPDKEEALDTLARSLGPDDANELLSEINAGERARLREGLAKSQAPAGWRLFDRISQTDPDDVPAIAGMVGRLRDADRGVS